MTAPLKPAPDAALVLADGTVFSGYGVGAPGTAAGELCFNTAMTGYQEILTDPSYMGQIITFTFPHIGNVGCNAEDLESRVESREAFDLMGEMGSVAPSPLAGEGRGEGAMDRSQPNPRPPIQPSHARGEDSSAGPLGAVGLILREAITEPSNFRATEHLDNWLRAHGITGITGIDTRALTRHLRAHGAQNGGIAYVTGGEWRVASEKAKAALAQAPDMNGLELAAHATTKNKYAWTAKRWEGGAGHSTPDSRLSTLPHVVAIDYGVKANILRSLTSAGCRVTVVPATVTAEEMLALKPDGVFLSNGPGDPAATGNYAVPVIKKIIEADVPLFGICLGHQMLGIALGCRTEKMRQGHRGANHPVKDIQTGKVEITSQNHGFAISDTGLPAEVEVTHRSLFDGTIQGIRHKTKPIFSVQGHPEASPGPHDSQYLFGRFLDLIAAQKKG